MSDPTPVLDYLHPPATVVPVRPKPPRRAWVFMTVSMITGLANIVFWIVYREATSRSSNHIVGFLTLPVLAASWVGLVFGLKARLYGIRTGLFAAAMNLPSSCISLPFLFSSH